ncbi:MAG: AbrB/MazE/SpoVT family DNA-binding domain-containing protein [Burkholderiaceae bacterium]|nr:AbrB/MazE/SpoVT family DNA-binding domain-containing protein [Burkholderiaceae bacterium]
MVPAVKITTIGNSLGIVLPREVLQRLRVGKGSMLYLVELPDGVALVPYDAEVATQIEALESVARSDRDVLRGLALRKSPARPATAVTGTTGSTGSTAATARIGARKSGSADD